VYTVETLMAEASAREERMQSMYLDASRKSASGGGLLDRAAVTALIKSTEAVENVDARLVEQWLDEALTLAGTSPSGASLGETLFDYQQLVLVYNAVCNNAFELANSAPSSETEVKSPPVSPSSPLTPAGPAWSASAAQEPIAPMPNMLPADDTEVDPVDIDDLFVDESPRQLHGQASGTALPQ
jgi:hypothetical protein